MEKPITNRLQSLSEEIKENKKVKVEGIETEIKPFNHLAPFRKYSRVNDHILRVLSHRNAQIRACIDGIAGTILSRQPKLLPMFEKDNSQTLINALNVFAMKFFAKVNRKGDTIRTLIAKAVRDLLVHDRFFIEKVRNREGKLVELYVRDPVHIVIEKDEHGVIKRFKQVVGGKTVEFSPEDMIYAVLHPCSYDDYGIPIIENIIDEVASLILSTRVIANYIFDDSIPPGILVLGEIGEVAYERLKQEFSNPETRSQIKVIRNIDPDKVDWVRFDRSLSSDNKLDYILDRLDKIIYKAFQIPTERELGSRGAAEIAYKVANSRLIEPIVKIIEDTFTYSIFVQEFDLPVRFALLKMGDLDSADFLNKSRAINLMVNNGVLTVNECRSILGFTPVRGGNKRMAKLGNEIVTFDSEGNPKPE